MPVWVLDLIARLSKVAPACLIGILAMGAGLFAYSSQNYASAEAVEALSKTIDKNFTLLLTRMNVSDAERVVSDIQNQIRQKEKEIADLEMVLADLAASEMGDSSTVLRDRAFGLKQDLADLRTTLDGKMRELRWAKDAVRAASGP